MFRGGTMLCMSGIDPFFRISFLFPKHFFAFSLFLFFFSKLYSAIVLVISRKNIVTVKTSEHWSVDMNSILNASNNGWWTKLVPHLKKKTALNIWENSHFSRLLLHRKHLADGIFSARLHHHLQLQKICLYFLFAWTLSILIPLWRIWMIDRKD